MNTNTDVFKCSSRDPIWRITNWGQIWTDTPQTNSKLFTTESQRAQRKSLYC